MGSRGSGSRLVGRTRSSASARASVLAGAAIGSAHGGACSGTASTSQEFTEATSEERELARARLELPPDGPDRRLHRPALGTRRARTCSSRLWPGVRDSLPGRGFSSSETGPSLDRPAARGGLGITLVGHREDVDDWIAACRRRRPSLSLGGHVPRDARGDGPRPQRRLDRCGRGERDDWGRCRDRCRPRPHSLRGRAPRTSSQSGAGGKGRSTAAGESLKRHTTARPTRRGHAGISGCTREAESAVRDDRVNPVGRICFDSPASRIRSRVQLPR